MEEFDFIVVGNEPAGIWLLTELGRLFGTRLRTGWIKFAAGESTTRCLFPKIATSFFGVEEAPSFSAQVITPTGVIDFSAEELLRRYPSLPERLLRETGLQSFLRLNGSDHSALNYTLRNHPDILGLASGIWKMVGRTDQVSSEVVLVSALMTTELMYWDPAKAIPSHTEVFQVDPRSLQSVEALRKNTLLFQFPNLPALYSSQWLMNTTFTELGKLAVHSKILNEALDLEPKILSPQAVYPFTVTLEEGLVGSPTSPVFVCLDTEDIPEPTTEIWPFENIGGRCLKAWVSGPRFTTDDCLRDSGLGVLRRLKRLFPFLNQYLESVFPPLWLETCVSDAVRQETLLEMERSRREWYRVITLLTQTRHPSVECILPAHQSQYPYPIGTLLTAQRVLSHLMKRWKKRLTPPKNPIGKLPPIELQDRRP